MAIYIAVYDIYPGDRKNLERLIERESDIRKQHGETLYTDSFGSVESMLESPMKYSLFIIDASDASLDATGSVNAKIAQMIREAGVIAPIILGYKPEITDPLLSMEDNVTVYQKQMTSAFLSEQIDSLLKFKDENPEKLEVRGDKATFYVESSEIMYAKSESSGITVYMTEGRSAHVLDALQYFYGSIENHKCFIMCGKNLMFNLDCISGISGNGISDRAFRMLDGTMVPVSVIDFFKIWKIWNEYRAKKMG